MTFRGSVTLLALLANIWTPICAAEVQPFVYRAPKYTAEANGCDAAAKNAARNAYSSHILFC